MRELLAIMTDGQQFACAELGSACHPRVLRTVECGVDQIPVEVSSVVYASQYNTVVMGFAAAEGRPGYAEWCVGLLSVLPADAMIWASPGEFVPLQLASECPELVDGQADVALFHWLQRIAPDRSVCTAVETEACFEFKVLRAGLILEVLRTDHDVPLTDAAVRELAIEHQLAELVLLPPTRPLGRERLGRAAALAGLDLIDIEQITDCCDPLSLAAYALAVLATEQGG